MKTVSLLFFICLPIDFIDPWQITQNIKSARVCILAYGTHVDKLSSPVVSSNYLVRFKRMTIFRINRDCLSNRPVCSQFVENMKSVGENCHTREPYKEINETSQVSSAYQSVCDGQELLLY